MSARGFPHRPVRRLPRDQPQVMTLLRASSRLVEPLSLDEAFVDLAEGQLDDLSPVGVQFAAQDLKAAVREVTGGITGSVGVASSKLVAKIASELDKPDGLVVVPHGSERELLRPMQVTVIPGVGPATAERLRRVGVHTIEDLEQISADELVRLVGQSHGRSLYRLARAEDDRPVVTERESKSVSIEDTFDTDLVDPTPAEGNRRAARGTGLRTATCAEALRTHGHREDPDARLHHPHQIGHPGRTHR